MAGKGQNINTIANLAGVPRPAPGAAASWEPSAASKARMEGLASAVEQGRVPPAQRPRRPNQGVPAARLGDEGGRRRKSRRHSKKSKKTRRHHRKH